jgi:hypothetical protein
MGLIQNSEIYPSYLKRLNILASAQAKIAAEGRRRISEVYSCRATEQIYRSRGSNLTVLESPLTVPNPCRQMVDDKQVRVMCCDILNYRLEWLPDNAAVIGFNMRRLPQWTRPRECKRRRLRRLLEKWQTR